MRLQTIRDALASTIRTALAGQPSTKDFNVYAYNPGALRFPCVVVEPVSGEFAAYAGTFNLSGRLGEVQLQLRVCVPSSNSAEHAQRLLDDLLGQGSGSALGIVDIFTTATGQNLGGAVEACWALVATDYGPGAYSADGDTSTPFYGATVPLIIKTRRS